MRVKCATTASVRLHSTGNSIGSAAGVGTASIDTLARSGGDLQPEAPRVFPSGKGLSECGELRDEAGDSSTCVAAVQGVARFSDARWAFAARPCIVADWRE